MRIKKIADMFSIDYYKSIPELNKEDQTKTDYEIVHATYKQDVKEFLDQVNKQTLKKIELMNHKNIFIASYNDFIDENEVGCRQNVESLLFQIIFENHSKFSMYKILKKESYEEVDLWQSFSTARGDLLRCENHANERFLIHYDKNRDTLILLNYYFEGNHDIVVKDLIPCSLNSSFIKRRIKFDTGNLLVTDRLWNEKFMQLIEKKNYESINFTQGVINQTDYALDNFNYILVSLTNCMPSLIKINNRLIVGYDDKDSRPSKYPSICCDIWAVTIIEEEHYLKLLQRAGLNPEEAKADLSSFLDEDYNHRIKVDPGEYDFYFDAGEPEHFTVNYKKAGHRLAKNLSAYLVLDKK